MAKEKMDIKGFMLRKGESVVLGVAGFFLFLLLFWGVSKGTSGINPESEAKKLTEQASNITRRIESDAPTDDLRAMYQPPESIIKPSKVVPVPAAEFAAVGNLFDQTGLPNTKRDNPFVLTIGDYQVDLIRAPMVGYDINFDEENNPQIAVSVNTKKSDIDKTKLDAAIKALKDAGKKGQDNRKRLSQTTPAAGTVAGAQGAGGVPGFPMGPGGGMGGRGGFSGGMGMGMRPGGAGGFNPYGLQGGAGNQQGQRTEKSIKYIPLKELDVQVKQGSQPALTVLPLRLITVNAVVPYKKQLDEIKRALRLPNPPPTAKPADIAAADAKAAEFLAYEGFEVQRRITKLRPDGEIDEIIQDWPPPSADPKDTKGNYLFEEMYVEKIHTRRFQDHLEEGFLPYFIRREWDLVMPLPQLAKDLGVKYPEVKLREIEDNIEKLKRANRQEVTKSDLVNQLSGQKGKDIYKSQTGDTLQAFGYDANKFGGFSPKPGDGPMNKGGEQANAADVDAYLLRFVDSDVTPGWTYQYRIRLKMQNPNYQKPTEVADPEYAKEAYKTLYSPWLEIQAITVPAESFLYAFDTKAYRDQINKEFPREGGDRETNRMNAYLNDLLQPKDYQAVVEIASWMERVRAGEGTTKSEPVGAWVVAEMPVGRGEYVGRRQYVKLPLWSSETQQYALREVTAEKMPRGKYLPPKGWLVDFSTKSILVDYEGGRVRTKSNFRFDPQGALVPISNPRPIEEEVATEMLILRQDGKLVVRNSHFDDADPNRKGITGDWTKWVHDAETNKSSGAGEAGGAPNPFDPKKNP